MTPDRYMGGPDGDPELVDDPYAPDQWYEGADLDAWGPHIANHFDTREEQRGER